MSAEQDLANANVQIANLITEVTRFRDSAMGLNAIYPTITEGRQAVGDGNYFSVPGGGAYMRLYRRQGTTAELIAEFPDRQSLLDLDSSVIVHSPGSGLPNEAGTAYSRNIGTGSDQVPLNSSLGESAYRGATGAGDLMAQGFAGIDSNADLIDVNETPTSRFFRFVGTGESPDPSINSGTFSGVVVRGSNANHALQMGVYTAGGDGQGGSFWYRKVWQGGVTAYRRVRDSNNTVVDSNGFIKAASPIFRLSNQSESSVNSEDLFTAAGAGAANAEATGVTATHDDTGVYTVTGSLGFAVNGWTIELPQDANGNRLVFVETEQAQDGTITVRTYSDATASTPIDIPDGRWVDLRLSMPAPPTNEHPDDTPAPTDPLTPEEEEQQRIEQLERWRASASITPRQARLVLAKHGLLAGVADAIASIEDEVQRQIAEIEWEYATSIERSAEWVGVLYSELGLSPEGLDDLFREGGLL